jgi:hypothetical protein
MNFTFTPIQNKLFNCFVLNIALEHGDADVTTYTKVTIDTTATHKLENYIKAFDAAAEIIDNRRSYGVEIPDDFEDTHSKSETYYIPLEYDRTSEGVSNYYAAISIQSITYYDDFGHPSLVTYID